MCKMIFCALVLICFVISSALPRVADQDQLSLCNHDEFACHDGSACFDLRFKCDGVRNCMDGSDEAYCSGTFGSSSDEAEDSVLPRLKRKGSCTKTQWQCDDGTCIPFDGKCDGHVDCPDRSDETLALCRKMPCQSNWFRCTYGACVDGTAPCNGITECADNSDELLPRCRNETTEVNGKFKCQDGVVISAANHCDGTPDCPDGSDETLASCADKKCPAYLFQCAYGACVDQGADCNGKQDCADGSDESEELCSRMGKRTAATPTVTNKGSCVLPPYPKHGTYVVSNVPNAQPGQSFVSFVLKVSCQLGYGIAPDNGGMNSNGTQQVYCVNGGMFSKMPECVRFCKVTPDHSVIYSCLVPKTNGYRKCNSYEAPGIKINPRCNSPNYYSPDVLSYMTCINGSWDRVVVCKPECGTVTPEGLQLIAGGHMAKRGEVPWHVGIYRKSRDPFEQICGGSLVSNSIVLSAAHCFWDDEMKQLPASYYAAATGKIYRPWNNPRDFGAQKSDIKDIHIPRKFQGAAANYQEDIAIVVLVTSFVYQTYIRPVCLSFVSSFNSRQLQPGNYGKVAGWGITSANGGASPILRVVDMPYIDVNTCIRTLPQSFTEYITGDKFCAGYTNGTALCQGDSGGGLAFADTEQGVKRYYLRGIVSTAPTSDTMCNVDTYTTFTEVIKHEDFIKKYI